MSTTLNLSLTRTDTSAAGQQTLSRPKPLSPWRNPTQLEHPSFLLCFPFSYSTNIPTNPWMTNLDEDRRQPNFQRAAAQFLELYRYLSAEALVYVLPTPREAILQDLVYTANLGIVLEHLEDKNTVVISHFTSEPRQGETQVGIEFFRQMGYNVWVPPTKFEGEAELKHLRENVYVGGYGIRSEKATYQWMEKNFNMQVVKLRLTDAYRCHLDGLVFPITRESTLVCTELLEPEGVAKLEKVTNVIDVSTEDAYSGICNSLRLAKVVLNSSHLNELKKDSEDYRREVRKNRRLESIAADLALEVGYCNLSEFHKSGAHLSSMLMHLNRRAYHMARKG